MSTFMEDVFAGQHVYGKETWEPVNTRDFNDKEKSQISYAKCTQGDYQKACCFILKTGGKIYYPFSTNTQEKVNIGDEFTLDELQVLTLQRGEDKIRRIVLKDR